MIHSINKKKVYTVRSKRKEKAQASFSICEAGQLTIRGRSTWLEYFDSDQIIQNSLSVTLRVTSNTET